MNVVYCQPFQKVEPNFEPFFNKVKDEVKKS